MGSAAWKHVVKRRVHLERAQPAGRHKKYGLLEKHSDYVKRARAFQAKRAERERLYEAARQRNPDEFRRGMLRGYLNEKGKFTLRAPEPDTADLVASNNTDRRVVELRRADLAKKAEELRCRLPRAFAQCRKPESHLLFEEGGSDDGKSGKCEEGVERDLESEVITRSQKDGRGSGRRDYEHNAADAQAGRDEGDDFDAASVSENGSDTTGFDSHSALSNDNDGSGDSDDEMSGSTKCDPYESDDKICPAGNSIPDDLTILRRVKDHVRKRFGRAYLASAEGQQRVEAVCSRILGATEMGKRSLDELQETLGMHDIAIDLRPRGTTTTTTTSTFASTTASSLPAFSCRNFYSRRHCLQFRECTWDSFYGVCRHRNMYHRTTEWLASTLMFLFFLLLLVCCCCICLSPRRERRAARAASVGGRPLTDEERNLQAALRQAHANRERLANLEAQLNATYNNAPQPAPFVLSPLPVAAAAAPAPAAGGEAAAAGENAAAAPAAPDGAAAPATLAVPASPRTMGDSLTTTPAAETPRIVINNIASDEQRNLRAALDEEVRRTKELEDRVQWLQAALSKRERGDVFEGGRGGGQGNPGDL